MLVADHSKFWLQRDNNSGQVVSMAEMPASQHMRCGRSGVQVLILHYI